MDFETPITNLPEARRYFQAMGCSSFHMSREYPERYHEYCVLKISPAIEAEWASEDVANKLSQLESEETQTDELWSIHWRLAQIAGDWELENYLDRLLEVTIALEPRLSKFDKLLVAETIVGRPHRKYPRGLIFQSSDSGRPATARGFADIARQFVSVPLTEADLEQIRLEIAGSSAGPTEQWLSASFTEAKLEQRRQKLLETLTQTMASCGIHLA